VRADARHNRELIASTAVDLFAERGPGVSMEEIARAAGLGVGTLYRHFPDRQALLEHIATDTLKRLLAAAQGFAAQELPRWQVLLHIVDYCTGLPLAMTKSLSETITEHTELPELVGRLNALFEEIAQHAQQEGTMRPDIAPSEVVGLLNAIVCRPGARADDALATVILDGLKTPGADARRPAE
jgi:AcrR family transcriptional regulator